jgi:hypothetical protein
MKGALNVFVANLGFGHFSPSALARLLVRV